MNGIGIIIPNADFSNSPLGQVTIVESNNERAYNIATAYCTAVGSNTHKMALKNFVKRLLDAGIWDDVKMFFPMIGDTLAHQMVDLKDTTRSAWAGANFSYESKGVHIANNIDAGVPSSNLWHETIPFIGVTTIFAGYTDDNESLKAHPIMKSNFKSSDDGSTLFFTQPDSFKFYLNIGEFVQLVQIVADDNSHNYDIKSGVGIISTGRRAVSQIVDQKNILYIDGEKKSVDVTPSFNNRTAINAYPIVGVSAGSPTNGGASLNRKDSGSTTGDTYVGQRALDGMCYAFGYASFNSEDKAAAFDTAFGTFLNETGKITSNV